MFGFLQDKKLNLLEKKLKNEYTEERNALEQDERSQDAKKGQAHAKSQKIKCSIERTKQGCLAS